MSQSFTIGRVTADLELKTSSKKTNYVRFDLAENIGYGGSSHTQYLQVWAWGDNATHLINGKVKKGSLIRVSGELILEEYKKQDNTTDKRLRVNLESWRFISTNKPKNGSLGDETPDTEPANPYDTPPGGDIDGDREILPK